jgi:hypothetical protein
LFLQIFDGGSTKKITLMPRRLYRLSMRVDEKLTVREAAEANYFMKRFIRTTAVVFPLLFFSACNPSKAPEATSPGASTATITASPNPVSASQGPGTTTVTWNTGDGSAGQVYVSKDGAAEALFAGGPSGSAAAPWIEAGKTFEFRLYAGTEPTKMLAKTQVTGQK